MQPPMNPAGRPRGEDKPDDRPQEPFLPDLSEGAETGVYLALLELLDEGLIITGDETILDANSAACKLLQRDYRQLAGRPLADIFPSERAFIEARARLFIRGEMRGAITVSLPAGGERELQFIAAPRLRPGIHALILSPLPAAGSRDDPAGLPVDTVWPRLAAALSQPVIVIDDAGRITAANAAALATLGMQRDELIGKPLGDKLWVEWPAADAPPVARLAIPGREGHFTARQLAGPRPGWRLLILPPSADARSVAPCVPAEDAGSTALQLPVDVFDAASQAILVTDASNRIVAVNRAFTEITGYSREEVLGRNPSLLSSGRQETGFYADMWQTLATSGEWQGEIWNRRKNGEIFPEWLTITAVRTGQQPPRHYIAMFTDLTARRQAEARAEYVARHDILTGLPNRRLFESRFKDAVERARLRRGSIGLLRIDVDKFKAVNQEHGDNTGDAFLQQIARRLLSSLPQAAVLARERSDTFLALLPDLDLAGATTRAADQLLAALAPPFRAEHAEVHLTASIGIALYPADGTDLETLLRRAGSALHQARRLGGNNHQRYVAENGSAGLDQADFGGGLYAALERQELEVHFQPLVDARSGRICAGEALLRWRHPELGLVPYRHFADAARENGLIVRLGDWILNAACNAAARWPTIEGAIPTVTVNVAIEQVMRGDFADAVERALGHAGLPADRLELDLDEGILATDNDHVRTTLGQLAGRGIRLAIDDFGRGLSSIPRLRRYPVRALKLAPGLVQGVGSSEDSEAVVEAIAGMAGSLGLKIFARGVSDAAQQAFLSALGCHLQQGPLFGTPLATDAFAAYLTARTG